jgi:2-polyprenyl-3-methyl-5-hydroxy-6-metoxy-1,4-benzoquinol methylase
MTDPTQRFDAAFFQRYYRDPETRVADAGDAERLVGLIAGIVQYVELPVVRILDAGCGIGLLREPLQQRFPQARYEGLEVSAYLCDEYGWTRGSVAEHVATTPYDLVICHDVLQYLDDRTAARAIANLGRLSRGALYLSVLTERDWRHAADQSLTDDSVHRRSGDWYRRRLKRVFRHLGSGVHCRRDLNPILWELETPWS